MRSTRLLRSKLLGAIVLAGLAPVIGVAYLGYESGERSTRAAIVQSLDRIAQANADQLERYLVEREGDVDTLAHLPVVLSHARGGGRNQRLLATLRRVSETYGYRDIVVLDEAGRETFSLTSPLGRGTPKDRQLERLARETATFLEIRVSPYEPLRPGSTAVLSVASPILLDGAYAGAVVVRVGEDAIAELLRQSAPLGRTGELVVARREGRGARIVTPLRHDSKAAFSRFVPFGGGDGSALQQAVRGSAGSGDALDYNGDEVIAVWRYVAGFDWGLVVKQGKSEALAPVADLRRHALGVALAGTLLLLIVGLLVARSLGRALREHARVQARMAAIVTSTSDAVMATDLEFAITGWNRGAEDLYGLAADEVLGQGIEILTPPETRAEASSALERATRGHPSSFETQHRCKDGHVLEVALSLAPLRDETDAVAGVSVISRDVSEPARLRAALERKALHDDLTQLPNRSLFMDRVVHSLESLDRRGGSLAIMVFDLDNFKNINDTYGHGFGDTVLVETARRLRPLVRAGDTLARLSGDEFAVLCPAIADETEGGLVAARLLAGIRTPLTVDGRSIHLAASLGITTTGSSDTTSDILLREADLALYRAKDRRRGGVEFFDSALAESLHRRVEIESALQVAVERDELALVFQPVVELSTGGLHGFEALVRWDSHELGPVSPDEFIPVAEQTGLIDQVGRWVTREALAWRSSLASAGGDASIVVAINLSPRQLANSRLVASISSEVARHGLPPGCITFEITETAVLRDDPEVQSALTALRAAGHSLALDDFGTGYASLAYLKRFQLDTVKIDREFVDGIDDAAGGDLAVVQATVAMASALGLDVVAEGVETEGQARILRSLGCRFAQGWHFGRPLDPQAAIEYALAEEPLEEMALSV